LLFIDKYVSNTFENYLIGLEIGQVNLPLSPFSQQYTHWLSAIREIAITDAEIGEHPILLGPKPQLRVSKDDIVVIIGDSSTILLYKVEDLLVGDRNQQGISTVSCPW
jgi:hypothetical protein